MRNSRLSGYEHARTLVNSPGRQTSPQIPVLFASLLRMRKAQSPFFKTDE
jgi:hypothetical protein